MSKPWPSARELEAWLTRSPKWVKRANAKHDAQSLKRPWLVPVKKNGKKFQKPVDNP